MSTQTKKMKIAPANCCKRCRFYHGTNSIVCAVYPYGPDSDTCSDYAPRVCNWSSLKQTLIIGLLGLVVSSGFTLWWVATRTPAQTTNKQEGANKPNISTDRAELFSTLGSDESE